MSVMYHGSRYDFKIRTINFPGLPDVEVFNNEIYAYFFLSNYVDIYESHESLFAVVETFSMNELLLGRCGYPYFGIVEREKLPYLDKTHGAVAMGIPYTIDNCCILDYSPIVRLLGGQ